MSAGRSPNIAEQLLQNHLPETVRDGVPNLQSNYYHNNMCGYEYHRAQRASKKLDDLSRLQFNFYGRDVVDQSR